MTEVTISEYGYIYYDEPKNLINKFVHSKIEKAEFDELYAYWKEHDEAKSVFEYSGYNYFKAKNYVGVIQTQNLSVEILPKIYESDESHVRTLFIAMLKPLLNINEVQINKTNLSTTQNKNIYEIFIRMFVASLDKLIHRGLKSHYLSKEENQLFLKGKLKFNQHIKQNYIHKERFYVEFDEYLPDRVENRLLKSTIALLLKKSKDYENKKALRQQLFIFDDVGLSRDYDSDISKINTHRGMEYYETPLRFAKVFLKHQSFTSLRGKENVFALLFPMEKVFEEYMEFVLNNSKEHLGIDKVLVNGGANEYLLSDLTCKMARLQPDYLLKMKHSKDIVCDAKWKLLATKEDANNECNTTNISSGDVYQIFAYLNYYESESCAYLLVPKTKELKAMEFTYNSNHQIFKGERKIIKIVPIDLQETIKINHKLQEGIF